MATRTSLWCRRKPPPSSSCFNIIATSIILFVIKIFVPLRMDDATLKVGDDAVHGETAYAIGAEGD